jgi:hypothetical protein
VDTIQYNKYIVTRYSNIINQIKAEADKF